MPSLRPPLVRGGHLFRLCLLFYASFDSVFCPVSLRLYWSIHTRTPLDHPPKSTHILVRMLLRFPRGLGDSDALVQAAGRDDCDGRDGQVRRKARKGFSAIAAAAGPDLVVST